MKPYYSDKFVKLYHADCREVLPHIQSENVFTFCSPPFNVGMNYGAWNDSMPHEKYTAFCAEWIAMMQRISDESCVYLPRIHQLACWKLLGEGHRQIGITWSPGGHIDSDGWIDTFVTMLTNAKPKRPIPDNWHNVQTRGLGEAFKEWDQGHPGYTSEDITGRALDGLAAPDALVVEPFSGSGTTLLCAKRRRMTAIGCEIDEAWCEKSAKRLSEPAPAERVPNLWDKL